MVKFRKSESGQAITEYILLMAMIVTIFVVMMRELGEIGIGERLAKPVKGPFAKVYQYGHPKAKGEEEGGYEYHPRAVEGTGNNFRIFINPGASR
ncbi:MAG: hypothetical protein A3K03_04835 [Bdellovibrionales bacterium RIFOXYD1_FULL_44_7]|nr:MAG: hypothetical protein A3K03_04835 [Bdellovibrionales bacterium RIFOXYD1_FULL_44_7]